MRFLKEKERYEKVEGDLRNAENDYEERRDHAAGLTAQVAERTQDLDDLRGQKAADDVSPNDREASASADPSIARARRQAPCPQEPGSQLVEIFTEHFLIILSLTISTTDTHTRRRSLIIARLSLCA